MPLYEKSWCVSIGIFFCYFLGCMTFRVRDFPIRRYGVTVPTASDRFAWLHGKLSAAFRILSQNGYSAILPLATLALRHYRPPCMDVS